MIHKILHRYIIAEFLKSFIMLLVILLGIIVLFDCAELMRRASKLSEVGFDLILQMALFKLPEAGAEVFPFAILLSAIFSLWSLSKRHELTVFRNAGLSAWQFILPMSVAAFMVGCLFVAVLNPLSTLMLGRYQNLEAAHLGSEQKLVTISKNGLWLRQKSLRETDLHESYLIFHSDRIDLEQWIMEEVMVLFFDKDDNFIKRVDAESAQLHHGYWLINNVDINYLSKTSEEQDEFIIKTNLTREDIIESFSDPQLVSFWSLPEYIKLMKNAGIETRAIRMHYYTLVVQPLFFAVLVLLAASFCLKPPRFQNGLHLAGLTILSAFGLFFLSSLLKALGGAEQLPVALAAIAPSLITTLIAVNVIMHTEDG